MAGRLVRPALVRPFVIACLAAVCVAAPAQAACTSKSQTARHVTLTVKGQRSNGFASLPRRNPKSLVVVAHGYGWTAAAWRTKLALIAAGDGAVAVAPDFRGLRFLPPPADGFPRSRGIPLRNAVADLTAYGQQYARACPSVRTIVLVGYSLGGAYSGNVLMSRPKRAGGRPLFDYYVGMEALQDAFSEFSLAKAIPNDAFVQGGVQDAANELGGTIDQKPAAYHAVNPIEHIREIRSSGVRGAILVHGIDDGLVPYGQATDMTKALRAAGIRTDLYSARKRRPGDAPDTTLSGRFGTPSGNTGHASDKVTRHLVPATGLHVIHDLLVRGRRPANRTLDAHG
jgi:dienelactone hydrolase